MISHHHKCLFIHIPKCGGTSIEHVFTELLNLKWKHRAPLLLRQNKWHELGPQRLAHLTALQYVECNYVPKEMYDNYFTFTFVRNPWARAVSIFHSSAFKRYPDFLSFAKDRYKNPKHKDNWFSKPQTSFFLGPDRKPQVNFIGKLETIDTDFKYIATQLDIDNSLLKHRNKTKKEVYRNVIDSHPSKQNYQEFYDDESHNIVSNYYSEDIKFLDYQFS